MTTTTSGLLLLLIGVTVLAGFLTGNLDRWLAYLFDPTRPGLTGDAAVFGQGPAADLRARGQVAAERRAG